MRVERDFEELLELFNKHKVRYCIVGAFAVAFHFKPRYTKDIDILIEPSIGNGLKIVEAIKEFGFGSLGLTEKDFAKEGQIIQLGYEPVRIDIITSISGCSFDSAWKNRRRGPYGQQQVNFIGIDELIRAKKASNRPQDKVDVKELFNKAVKKS